MLYPKHFVPEISKNQDFEVKEVGDKLRIGCNAFSRITKILNIFPFYKIAMFTSALMDGNSGFGSSKKVEITELNHFPALLNDPYQSKT